MGLIMISAATCEQWEVVEYGVGQTLYLFIFDLFFLLISLTVTDVFMKDKGTTTIQPTFNNW